MAQARPSRLLGVAQATGRALSRLEVLALFPFLALLAMSLGLGDAVLLGAFVLPGLLALRALGQAAGGAEIAGGGLTNMPHRGAVLEGCDALLAMLDRVARVPGHDSACIVLQIDDWDGMADRLGMEMAEDVAQRCGERICTALRRDDLVARLGDARFGVVLHPIAASRLGTRKAITGRLRTTLAEPIALDGTTLRLTISAGHSGLLREAGDIASATFAAAEAALGEAHRAGSGTVRAYAPGLLRQRKARADLAGEVETALDSGEISPWFQPQICAVTGAISGFEALARWEHPDRGLLLPGDFLPSVADAGRMGALGQTILRHALGALQRWDRAGLGVPCVSVNVSAVELRSATLADHIAWELDHFDLRPDRLTVEILETVAAADAGDQVTATIGALHRLGVALDLDDFGIGQATLSAISHFGVARIKIDRSFVIGLDQAPEQQAMVAAILAMSGHLGIDTLAEGVETAAVQLMLTQMGCGHLQGYHIARPMPVTEVVAWATAHDQTIAASPVSGLRAG